MYIDDTYVFRIYASLAITKCSLGPQGLNKINIETCVRSLLGGGWAYKSRDVQGGVCARKYAHASEIESACIAPLKAYKSSDIPHSMFIRTLHCCTTLAKQAILIATQS